MRLRACAAGIFFLVTVAGCAENSQQQALADAEGGYTALAVFTVDPTSLLYTDVAAGAAPSDNPWHWTGFALYPPEWR